MKLPVALAAVVAALALAVPVSAKDSLGIFLNWAAFKDAETPRCYAIAAPEETISRRELKPYLSVGFWPEDKVTHQLYVRLSRARSLNSGVTLTVGGRRFRLTADRNGAWAKDRRMDLQIVSAMRTSRSLSIESIGRDGRSIVDAYALRGAPSAIDAAALGCAEG